MDAAVFVLSADPPVSAAERDLYVKVTGMSVATFTVLNKADHLDEAGLSEAAEFTSQVLAEAAEGPGAPVRIYALSARAALNGGDPGFATFAADFRTYLADRRVTDLRSSAVMQAQRVARSLLDEVALTQRAAHLTAGEAADRVARFSERLAKVAVRARTRWRWSTASPAGCSWHSTTPLKRTGCGWDATSVSSLRRSLALSCAVPRPLRSSGKAASGWWR